MHHQVEVRFNTNDAFRTCEFLEDRVEWLKTMWPDLEEGDYINEKSNISDDYRVHRILGGFVFEFRDPDKAVAFKLAWGNGSGIPT